MNMCAGSCVVSSVHECMFAWTVNAIAYSISRDFSATIINPWNLFDFGSCRWITNSIVVNDQSIKN